MNFKFILENWSKIKFKQFINKNTSLIKKIFLIKTIGRSIRTNSNKQGWFGEYESL